MARHRLRYLDEDEEIGLLMGRHRPWSRIDEDRLCAIFPHVSSAQVAIDLGRPLSSVQNLAYKLGLRKTSEYMASPAACRLRRGDNVGKPFRFRPGIVPFNKGKRTPGYAPGRMAETQFKKGQRPPNAMPMWSFRWVDGYLMLKTGAPTPKPTSGWEYVHRLIWEQAHGPLPGWRVARLWWKDGDHGNCSLSNLELVRGSDHVKRTSVHNLPPALRQVIQLTGALKRKIRNREKDSHEELDGRSSQSSLRSA
jgi:hypothetical protein